MSDQDLVLLCAIEDCRFPYGKRMVLTTWISKMEHPETHGFSTHQIHIVRMRHSAEDHHFSKRSITMNHLWSGHGFLSSATTSIAGRVQPPTNQTSSTYWSGPHLPTCCQCCPKTIPGTSTNKWKSVGMSSWITWPSWVAPKYLSLEAKSGRLRTLHGRKGASTITPKSEIDIDGFVNKCLLSIYLSIYLSVSGSGE